MRISTLTLFPDLYKPFLKTSLLARAQDAGIVSFSLDNLFSYAGPKQRIDSQTYGPGTGMLLKPEIIQQAIEQQEQAHGPAYKVFFSPHGKLLDQRLLKELSQIFIERKHIMLVPSRYEGMDARIEEEYADTVLSIGNYVLMGGDLPAMVLMEGLLRLIPGVVGKEESVLQDSFSGPFVDYPEYTTPVVWKGREVPEIVRSGNHKAIKEWRTDQAVNRSVFHHFGWVRSHVESTEDTQRVAKVLPPHYVVLMHDQVMVDTERSGTSSITSLDIHDIARSARTYGAKGYYLVSPLKDQQKIAQTLLDFWQTDVGITYNPWRHKALEPVRLAASLDEVLTKIDGDPLLLGTSAQSFKGIPAITYFDQETVWAHKRPVVLLLGTARGLAPELLERCDYMLGPLEGFSDFNHLSVRSAAAIILDRWLGINKT